MPRGRCAGISRLAGRTVSPFGVQITGLALPLTAVRLLYATRLERGVLGTMGTVPYLLVGLFRRVYVDQSRRRSLLVWEDSGRAFLLLAVSVLYLTHHLALRGS